VPRNVIDARFNAGAHVMLRVVSERELVSTTCGLWAQY